MRIVVTGGTGFLGSRVVDQAVATGHDVIGLARSDRAAQALRDRGARPVTGNLDDPDVLAEAFLTAGAPALLNIASLGFGHAGAILAAAHTAGIRRAVFVSTTGIFTALNPPSKQVRLAAERAIQASDLDWTIIRPTMIYGAPDDRNMARLLALVRRTPLVPLPGASCLHQPVHVDDLAATVLRALDADASIGRAYNVAGPRPLPLREIVTAAATATGRRVHGVPVAVRPMLALAVTYERHARHPGLKAEQIARLAEDKAFDITAARRDLGHRPRPFTTGIAQQAALQPTSNLPPTSNLRPLGQAGRYVRTVRQLRPQQVATRARLRMQRAALSRWPRLADLLLSGPPLHGHWPASFLPTDGRCPPAHAEPRGWPGHPTDPDRRGSDVPAELSAGRLTLLGHTRTLGADPRQPSRWDWEQAGAPLLWRYHLHYWDWAWPLTADGDHFARLYLGWRTAVPHGHRVAWSPYVASLRAWTLCAIAPRLAPDGPAAAPLAADLAAHRAYLRLHQETDVGGNHLLKNYKALVGLAVAAGDHRDLARRVPTLVREAGRQILPDGGHHERAPAYHCQVLADLVDIADLLTAAGHPVPPELADLVTRMRTWLAAVLAPDGTVPLLNDGFPVSPALLRDLLRAYPLARHHHLDGAVPTQPTPIPAADPAPTPAPRPQRAPITASEPSPRSADSLLLADSGLAIVTAGGWWLLADVGLPCPQTLPAHAHADTLSFLLWWEGRALLVDTGTSTYAPGPRRDHERGTAAHNTVTVDDADSTEVWGTFRAGRRARPTLTALRDSGNAVTLTASHDGYRHLPGSPEHRRTWHLDPAGLTIDDHLIGTGRHRLAAHFHFAPGVVVSAQSDGTTGLAVTTPGGHRLQLTADAPGRWEVRPTPRALGWERTSTAPTAVLHLPDAHLPLILRTRLLTRIDRGLPSPLSASALPRPLPVPHPTPATSRHPAPGPPTGHPPQLSTA